MSCSPHQQGVFACSSGVGLDLLYLNCFIVEFSKIITAYISPITRREYQLLVHTTRHDQTRHDTTGSQSKCLRCRATVGLNRPILRWGPTAVIKKEKRKRKNTGGETSLVRKIGYGYLYFSLFLCFFLPARKRPTSPRKTRKRFPETMGAWCCDGAMIEFYDTAIFRKVVHKFGTLNLIGGIAYYNSIIFGNGKK